MAKKWWQSKTLWINVIMAVAAFVPVASEYLTAHPEIFVVVFAVINMILRIWFTDAAIE